MSDPFVEDAIDVALIQLFPGPGVMVEVGAAGPHLLNIGRRFRKAGWRVLAVEPNPDFANLHRDFNNEIAECAASDFDADDHDFYIFRGNSTYWGHQLTDESFSALGMRTGWMENPDDPRLIKVKVSVRKLDTIFEHRNITHVDLLVVDVEGWELDVMRGLTINPKIVVLENLHADSGYVDYMIQRGYTKAGYIGHNDIYVFPLDT